MAKMMETTGIMDSPGTQKSSSDTMILSVHFWSASWAWVT